MSAQVMSFSTRRVGAMILRYWYLLRSSWPRLVERAKNFATGPAQASLGL